MPITTTQQAARNLRKNLTDAEKKLWPCLRQRQLGQFRFRRQVPIGPHIADFACFDPKIIIEVDGAQHADEETNIYDQLRTKCLESRGFLVLRFWNHDVLSHLDCVADEILRNCLLRASCAI